MWGVAQSTDELREELSAQTAALGALRADVAAAEAQRAQELQETVARRASLSLPLTGLHTTVRTVPGQHGTMGAPGRHLSGRHLGS